MKTIKQKNETLKHVVFTLLGWLVVWSQYHGLLVQVQLSFENEKKLIGEYMF
jgi:hypothetical protein